VGDRVLRLIGLALRARRVAIGREACKRAARRGTLFALVIASDAGDSAPRDSGATGVPVVPAGVDKTELGRLVGRDALAVLGITDPGIAAGLVGDRGAPDAS